MPATDDNNMPHFLFNMEAIALRSGARPITNGRDLEVGFSAEALTEFVGAIRAYDAAHRAIEEAKKIDVPT